MKQASSQANILCIAGGGTGGHVMPALALADAARERWGDLQVDFIGAERGLEATLLPKRGEHVLLLQMHAVQGVNILRKLMVLGWEIPRAVWQIRQQWKTRRPTLLVGVGGYASATGVLAAIISRVPVVLYEQNAIPGLVNRRLARFCQRIMLGFSNAQEHLPANKCVHTGNIVRKEIAAITWQAHTPPCLLVLGGSQGAMFLNQTVPQACHLLQQAGHVFTIRHICGGDGALKQRIEQDYQEANITAQVTNFCHDMPNFYAAGDMMIARSGAMTVAEASMVGMPTLFVPLPHAADQHQTWNARSLCNHQAAMMVEQHDTQAEDLADKLQSILFNQYTLQEMSHKARQLAVSDAQERQLQALSPWLLGGQS